jgi:hypothetical protein
MDLLDQCNKVEGDEHVIGYTFDQNTLVYHEEKEEIEYRSTMTF